ncbi:EF-hand domain-containing protein [Streptomyces sp. NPDC014733]|uniref:EF-hand domain-containing protein n=1 Tax=Streptomyces sp. NPDC014733 TaxID=3364885 RepID=UPI003701AC24
MADIEKAREQFARFDEDGDGLVTAEEFRRAMAEMGDRYLTGATAQTIINSKDTDGDGRLSFDEFWASLQG